MNQETKATDSKKKEDASDTTKKPDAPKKDHCPGHNLYKKIEANNPSYDKKLVQKAVYFAVKHHGSQKRASGEPYYQHPISVAEILADLNMDITTIVTAILHDTVEDTEITAKDIKKEFGKDVSILVNGVTKLTKMELPSESERQAENFRKLLLAISEDIRVLLVKLADRLHNMRTLQYIKKPEKRLRIAVETMEIYAPLAERIGMQNIKDELQNIAFKEINPEGFESVINRLSQLKETDKEIILKISTKLEKILKDSKLKPLISGREKKPYSIWRKMHKKNATFEQLTDIIAFRVILNDIGECYQALGIIHSNFNAVPEYFKDYISTPKVNGYSSLHTVVIGPENKRIEIQIRTEDMHEVSEVGVAAHWSYKQGMDYSFDGKQYKWIRELLHIVSQEQGSTEFMEDTKLEMYHDQVFCFTPRGDLIALPVGATAVDFAFAVHSEIGKTCVGAKINNRIMPLRTKLQNGDQIDILQSNSQTPSKSWESFVITGKARSEIRKFLKNEKESEYINLGRTLLEKSLIQEKITLDDELIESNLDKFNKNKVSDVYKALGEGLLTKVEVFEILFPDRNQQKKKNSIFSIFKNKKETIADASVKIPISGISKGMAIHYASCCHPLPGENIIGIINSGNGITIHTSGCNELEYFLDNPERWVNVFWEDKDINNFFVVRINAVLANKKGALADIASSLAKEETNITNFRIINRANDFYEVILDIEVLNIAHFKKVMKTLSALKVVHTIQRYKEGEDTQNGQ